MSQELTFEETMAKLEDVVDQLERGDSLTLDESLTAFGEGVRLTRLCRKKLDDAELRVQQLIDVDAEESPVVPFEAEGAEDEG